MLFLAGIFLPLADRFIHLDRTPPLNENRNLAALPEFKWSKAAIKTYPSKFESYYNDHFGFRTFLVRNFYRFKVNWLGVSPATPASLAATTVRAGGKHDKNANLYPRVIIGRKGWLYYGEDGEVEDYRGTRVFGDRDLRQWQQVLEERRIWSEGHGIRYLFFIAPNKSTIYPEYMPPSIRKIADRSGLDVFYSYLRDHTQTDLLDVRDAVRAGKKDFRVYEITGTHWNEIGAYFAYAQIMNRLAVESPELRPHPLSDFEVQSHQGQKDLSLLLGMGDEMPETILELAPKFTPKARRVEVVPLPQAGATPHSAFETGDTRLPRAILFGDSFSFASLELFAEHFERFALYRQVNFTPEIIAAEKPDIIIQEIVERTAMGYVPANFPAVRNYKPPQ